MRDLGWPPRTRPGERHACSCRNCGDFPSGPPTGPGHFAVRFERRHHFLNVFEGDRKLQQCFEVSVNRAGISWAIVARQPMHHCVKCNNGPCLEVVFGEFRVEGECVPR